MDRPPVRSSSTDEHWAPDHLVLDRRVLTYAGRLLVERDAAGTVVQHSPLAGMAAVEQRYPGWALGPFGTVETERELPDLPGVYALVESGVVRYVGASSDLARTFGPRGVGAISRRDCQSSRNEERCRLNRLVVAGTAAGRTVDLYVLVTSESRRPAWLPGADRGESPTEVAAEMQRVARGSWHLPT